MEKERFDSLQTIFKAGEKADKVYLVVKGSIGIFLPDNWEKEPNFVIGPNEIFGEMGVIDDELRMATARAMEDSLLLSLNREEFNKHVEASNVFVKGVLGMLSERLRKAQRR